MESKEKYYYQENFINAFRISLESTIPTTYFNMLCKDIDAIDYETSRKSEIKKYLIGEYNAFYNEMGIAAGDNQAGYALEGLYMSHNAVHVSEMSIFWYESITRKIRSNLICEELSGNLWKYLQEYGRVFVENPFLAVLYDYNTLNAKAKNIVAYGSLSSSTFYPVLSINPSGLRNPSIKMRATKELIDELQMNPHAGVTFIFWALMVLTADHRDYCQHLSEICNMADLIGMSDKTILDIMDVINIVYGRVEPEKVELRSEIARYVFENVVRMYIE